jgi:hypothetical protein
MLLLLHPSPRRPTQVTNDLIVDPMRVISVNVSCSLGGDTQPSSATVNVLDDDVTPNDVQFTQATLLVNEGDLANLAVAKTGGSSFSQVRCTIATAS